MTGCTFMACQNDAEGRCEKCKQAFCGKHLSTGPIMAPRSNRQIYRTYCVSCMQEIDTMKEFRKGSRWNSGAAIQIYIIIGAIAVILVFLYIAITVF